jgi:deazaflavin-dependent oxidoreductase (nitroreductase family)
MSNEAKAGAFREPSVVEAAFNRALGFLVGLGIGPSYMRLLQVRGRKTGRTYSTPVNLLEVRGKTYLVAPRGRTQWVRNAGAAGEVTVKRGRLRRKFRLRTVAESEKPELLKAYLERYASQVQRYFSVRAGAPTEAFGAVAGEYPVFELISA